MGPQEASSPPLHTVSDCPHTQHGLHWALHGHQESRSLDAPGRLRGHTASFLHSVDKSKAQNQPDWRAGETASASSWKELHSPPSKGVDARRAGAAAALNLRSVRHVLTHPKPELCIHPDRPCRPLLAISGSSTGARTCLKVPPDPPHPSHITPIQQQNLPVAPSE